MKITFSKKLAFSFTILTLIVVVTGVTGLLMLNSVSRSGDIVINQKMPFKDVSMEAIIASGQALNACRNYLLSEAGLDAIEEDIEEYLEDFDMFIAMVKHGTESEEFKNSPAGRMYVKDGLDIKVPRGTDKMLAMADKISKHKIKFNRYAHDLITAHKARVQYSFNYRGIHYDLPGFLYTGDIKHRKWVRALEEAAEYGVDFSGELNPEKCFVGQWLSSYTADDTELTKMLESSSAAEALSSAWAVFCWVT